MPSDRFDQMSNLTSDVTSGQIFYIIIDQKSDLIPDLTLSLTLDLISHHLISYSISNVILDMLESDIGYDIRSNIGSDIRSGVG